MKKKQAKNKTGKKGQGITFNVIVVAAIALIVLVVIIMIFTGKIRVFSKDVDEPTAKKTCSSYGYGADGAACYQVCPEGYEEILARTECFDTGQQCCRPSSPPTPPTT